MNRAPAASSLKQMSPEAVRSALLTGSMAMIGMGLSSAQLKAVATFVTGKEFGGDALPKRAYCSTSGPAMDKALAGPHWNGWGVNPENHRFQPAAMARLDAADIPRLKLKWAFAYPGTSRAHGQPAVAGGRLFAGSAIGRFTPSTRPAAASTGPSNPISASAPQSLSPRSALGGRRISATRAGTSTRSIRPRANRSGRHAPKIIRARPSPGAQAP